MKKSLSHIVEYVNEYVFYFFILWHIFLLKHQQINVEHKETLNFLSQL